MPAAPSIFIIEDDQIMAECLSRAVSGLTPSPEVRIFHNVIEAISAFSDSLPDLILLDVLLDGPDGFTLLNELSSYADTAKIPVLLVTSLDLKDLDLSHYGIVDIISKETMTPATVLEAATRALGGNYA